MGELLETLLMMAMIMAYGLNCVRYGASLGQKVSKGEGIKTPTINPMEKIREKQDKRQAEAEQHRIDAIMRNIERYDGTSAGQEDIPH